MPVETGRASVGGQGKAVPVDPTTVQLQLPIATAEVPKAIVNAETATSVTMEAMSLPPSSHITPACKWVTRRKPWRGE